MARASTVETRERVAVTAFGTAIVRIVAGLVLSRAVITVIPDPHLTSSNGANRRSLSFSFLHADALAFLRIVQHGYDPAAHALPSFFPLYPYTARAVSTAMPLSDAWALLLVSWIGLFFAIWAVMELARTLAPDTAWFRCGVLFAWLPASVFLIAGYSEATCIALAGWALVYLVRDRWLASAVLAGLAATARPEGALVGAVLAGYLLWRRRYAHALLALLMSEIGVLVVTLFLSARYHHLFAQVHAQQIWHRQLTWPLHPVLWSLARITRGEPIATPSMESNTVAVVLLDDVMILAGLALLVWLVQWARRDIRLWPLVAYSGLYLALIVSNGPFGKSPEGAARTLMCVVPLWLFPAALRSERTWDAVLLGSAVLAIGGQVLFNGGFWFT